MSYRSATSSLSSKVPQATSQTVQTPGTIANNAGGFVFSLDIWKRLDRFLILGSDSNTYYVGKEDLTLDNAKVVIECIKADYRRTVDQIIAVSDGGRASKNTPAIFALALAIGHDDASPECRKYALANLGKVCRIGTHLFQFAHFVDGFRGWGSGLKKGFASWYNDMPADKLAYQAIKYVGRTATEGDPSSRWSHRDLLRKCHPVGDSDHSIIYDFITKGNIPENIPHHLSQLSADKEIKSATTVKQVVDCISAYKLPHEVIPDQFKNDPDVWRASIPTLGLTALVRVLNRLTAYGVLKPLSKETTQVVARLTNQADITKSRIHPLNVLAAIKTYSQGHGMKGNLTWSPVQQIADALEKMFYMSFGNVNPTGKNILIALDVSGSMNSPIKGDYLSCREASAALAMVTVRTEANYHVVGFTSGAGGYKYGNGTSRWREYDAAISPINITASQSLSEVIKETQNLPFGGTDCSLPMLYAMAQKLDVDAFIILTDSETYANPNIKPHEALVQYRKTMNKPNAKLIVVGMTATNFTIADPNDASSIDVVGFDSNTPQMISDFIAG